MLSEARDLTEVIYPQFPYSGIVLMSYYETLIKKAETYWSGQLVKGYSESNYTPK